MSGWQLILFGAVMAAGALLFLRLVAYEIELVERDLQHFEVAQRKAYERRRELSAGGEGNEEIPLAHAV